MNRQVLRLVLGVTAVWAAVLVFGQWLADPPLSAVVSIGVGVALTDAAILGFGSVLRGPRARRRRRRRTPRPAATPTGEPSSARGDLFSEAATRTVSLLRPMLGDDAVAITDLDQMLAFAGPGEDHHGPGSPLRSPARAQVLATGTTTVVPRRDGLGCPDPACPLESAIFAPLHVHGELAGTVSVYRTEPGPPSVEIAEGLAGILALHLELAELERHSRLNADARLQALRAQINPHFLFNTLNTIASKVRTHPDEGRALLLRLADFFRYAIRQHDQFAEFAQEFYFVRTYVALEQARFGDDLRVVFDVDPQVLAVEVPVLVIQPLVENAIKHGLSRKVGQGTVTLRARVDLMAREVDIQVRDDGVGIEPDELAAVLAGRHRTDGSGVGMSNIAERLSLLFDERAEMDVRSRPGDGTTVRLRLPMR